MKCGRLIGCGGDWTEAFDVVVVNSSAGGIGRHRSCQGRREGRPSGEGERSRRRFRGMRRHRFGWGPVWRAQGIDVSPDGSTTGSFNIEWFGAIDPGRPVERRRSAGGPSAVEELGVPFEERSAPT
ncbi:MAG: hypothetical protein ACLT98_13985 [Eggerthellaceae bacterium]